MKHKVFTLYPTDICLEVFIGKRKQMVKSLCEDKSRTKSEWKEMVGDTSCVVSDDNHIYMFLQKGMDDLSTIAHESVHVSWFLADIVGFEFDVDHQEMQAYYVDYVFGKVLELKNG